MKGGGTREGKVSEVKNRSWTAVGDKEAGH